ncbi:helix-turn-helix domain-containing protein [Aeoliella mucimassa]|uniref:Helix-turn-helix domain protein n=1 Tax=Aeoliella mucimassa TaxID=2527972 RepID=A0A518AM43_9BACT|nr:helix-turn-helix domain-containing protein [Aeoliella mucimassa]QDU55789.1 Helix-turn-helix domain protein [Aeoliella mucimassa]
MLIADAHAVGRRSLTRIEAAKRLGCSVTTIDNRIRTGAIKAIRNGRLVRIPLAEIERVESDGIEA